MRVWRQVRVTHNLLYALDFENEIARDCAYCAGSLRDDAFAREKQRDVEMR